MIYVAEMNNITSYRNRLFHPSLINIYTPSKFKIQKFINLDYYLSFFGRDRERFGGRLSHF
jgi:hypothetical protein